MKNFNRTSIILASFTVVVVLACLLSLVLMCITGMRHSPQDGSNDAVASFGLKETYDLGDGYIKSMVFVGDRTIERLDDTHTDISPFQVWSGEDGTLKLDYNLSTTPILYSTEDRFSSVAEAARIYRPAYMVITVGIDNGVYCTKEKFKEYYIKLIRSVADASPYTRIMLQSVFPISRAAEKADSSISNDRICEVNSWIAELCGETATGYLDTHSALADKRGRLKAEYDSGDGITLNRDGYDAMLYYIRTHGYIQENEQ